MEGFLGEQQLVSLEGTPFEGFTPAQWAAFYLQEYGGIDGEHHKTWVIDQVARILKGTQMEVRLASWQSGYTEYRFSTVEPPSSKYVAWRHWMKVEDKCWDEGIAP